VENFLIVNQPRRNSAQEARAGANPMKRRAQNAGGAINLIDYTSFPKRVNKK